jgi:hypothetical protein
MLLKELLNHIIKFLNIDTRLKFDILPKKIDILPILHFPICELHNNKTVWLVLRHPYKNLMLYSFHYLIDIDIKIMFSWYSNNSNVYYYE